MTQLSLDLKPSLGLYDDPKLIEHYPGTLFCYKQPGPSFYEEYLMKDGGPVGSVRAEGHDEIRMEIGGDGYRMTLRQAQDLALRLNCAVHDLQMMEVSARQQANRRKTKREAI